MHVVRTQVDHDENDVGCICGPLAVAEELIILDIMKVQAPVTVQCRIVTADTIHMADEFTETIRSFEVPLFDLIFL